MTAARAGHGLDREADFRLPIRIYWEDTDAAGIVFYANYLKFFERARTEWLRSFGLEQERLRSETGMAFVVTETSLRYFVPARLDDMIGQRARRAARPGQPGRDTAGPARRSSACRRDDPGRLCRSRNFPAAPHP